MKHTPGPWEEDNSYPYHSDWISLYSGSELVADIPRKQPADARLIAAAPDMLEALDAILEAACIDIDDKEVALSALAEIRALSAAAIEKATK